VWRRVWCGVWLWAVDCRRTLCGRFAGRGLRVCVTRALGDLTGACRCVRSGRCARCVHTSVYGVESSGVGDGGTQAWQARSKGAVVEEFQHLSACDVERSSFRLIWRKPLRLLCACTHPTRCAVLCTAGTGCLSPVWGQNQGRFVCRGGGSVCAVCVRPGHGERAEIKS
jgi:hypothetical protein